MPGPCFPGASWSPSPVLSAPSCLACSAHPAAAVHGGSPLWCPRGLALVSLCSPHLPSPLSLARSEFSAPFSGAPRPPPCLMSRGDELRQLAAQLSVLAALEDSIALGLSRVMGPAGSGRSAAPAAAGSPHSSRSLRCALGGALAQPRGRSVFGAHSDPHVCLWHHVSRVMTCAGLQPSSPRLPSSRTPFAVGISRVLGSAGTAAGSHAASAAATASPGCVFHVPSGAVQPRGCKGLAARSSSHHGSLLQGPLLVSLSCAAAQTCTARRSSSTASGLLWLGRPR